MNLDPEKVVDKTIEEAVSRFHAKGYTQETFESIKAHCSYKDRVEGAKAGILAALRWAREQAYMHSPMGIRVVNPLDIDAKIKELEEGNEQT